MNFDTWPNFDLNVVSLFVHNAEGVGSLSCSPDFSLPRALASASWLPLLGSTNQTLACSADLSSPPQ